MYTCQPRMREQWQQDNCRTRAYKNWRKSMPKAIIFVQKKLLGVCSLNIRIRNSSLWTNKFSNKKFKCTLSKNNDTNKDD